MTKSKPSIRIPMRRQRHIDSNHEASRAVGDDVWSCRRSVSSHLGWSAMADAAEGPWRRPDKPASPGVGQVQAVAGRGSNSLDARSR